MSLPNKNENIIKNLKNKICPNVMECINKFNKLAEYLQETITIEKVIHQLASNPQVINMSEYISIYNKVKEIYKFFEESKYKFSSNLK